MLLYPHRILVEISMIYIYSAFEIYNKALMTLYLCFSFFLQHIPFPSQQQQQQTPLIPNAG